MSGAELRARRKALRLSQVELARRAKMSRDAVQYWENKAVVDPRQVGPRRFFEVLGVQDYPTRPAYARAGWGLIPGNGDRLWSREPFPPSRRSDKEPLISRKPYSSSFAER